MKTWQIQEAKGHFSEVMDRARREGPQAITRHGKPHAVVMSAETFEAMAKAGPSKPNLIDYLKSGPSFEGVDLLRSRDTGREVDLD